MASAQQADRPASGDGRRSGGYALPDVGPRFTLFDAPDQLFGVYPAAQNERTSDPDQHVYLYEPPLRFRVDDDGATFVRRNDADPRKVIFYLEGVNQDLEKRIHELLDAEGRKVLARNVHPLQYTFIMLSDDSGQWRSRYPVDNESLPAPQIWIPFEVDFTGHEDGAERADEFENRLRTQEVEFDVILVYGGRVSSVNTIELTTRHLLETSFYADLTGNGDFGYVSRNQIKGALAVARTEIQQRVYIENPDVMMPPLEWPERTWERITVAWEDFLSGHRAETSKYGFDGNDLTPDRFTRFEEHLKTEMEDETKDYIDIHANMKAEASFLGIVDVGSEYGGQVKKEEFERRRRVNENGVEWEGDAFRPRSIDLFVMDASKLASEVRIGSYVITVRPETQSFTRTISSRQTAGLARRSSTEPSGAVSDFPSGAVVAFDREDGCPAGWSEYRDADGRFIVGTGRHSVHDAYGNVLDELEFGGEGGERTHRLKVKEMPKHHHRHWFSNGAGDDRAPDADFRPHESGGRDYAQRRDTTATGDNKPHNNMPPYIALRFCRLD